MNALRSLLFNLLFFSGTLAIAGGGLPALFLVALVVTAIAAVVVSRTRVGRHIKAVGGDDRAAARAGISVVKIRTGVLLLSAVGAVIGGIILVAMTDGPPSTSNVLG